MTVSVDGKEAWSVRSVDFEEALGRCDVRTNTVVPVSCLRLGTPRRCCTSRILSCNGVHALSCSHLCHLSPPLFLDSLVSNGGFVLQRGERHFLKLSVSLSLSLSLSPSPSSFMARNQSGQRLWFWSTGFFFNFVKQWWWDRSPQRQAISNSPNNSSSKKTVMSGIRWCWHFSGV